MQNIKKITLSKNSLLAGELVGKLYDAVLKQYKNPDSHETFNMLCVRLVFCLYAEDAGIFGDVWSAAFLTMIHTPRALPASVR